MAFDFDPSSWVKQNTGVNSQGKFGFTDSGVSNMASSTPPSTGSDSGSDGSDAQTAMLLLTLASGLGNSAMQLQGYRYYTDMLKKMNDDNIAFQQEENKLQRELEARAVQTRVNDLRKSGLSPTLAAGSAASVAPVQAPQNKHAPSGPPNISLMNPAMMTAFSDMAHKQAETKLLNAQAESVNISNSTLMARNNQSLALGQLEIASRQLNYDIDSAVAPDKILQVRYSLDETKANIGKILADSDLSVQSKAESVAREFYYSTSGMLNNVRRDYEKQAIIESSARTMYWQAMSVAQAYNLGKDFSSVIGDLLNRYLKQFGNPSIDWSKVSYPSGSGSGSGSGSWSMYPNYNIPAIPYSPLMLP